MDLTSQTIIQILIATFLGSIIGLERELAGKDPSLRTFMLITLGSCIFTLISIQAPLNSQMGDPGRIAAQIVTGIGFLGAGAIFQAKNSVRGLTTAALIWFAAGVGMLVGFNNILLAVFVTFLALLMTISLTYVHKALRKIRPSNYPSDDEDEY